MKMKGSRDIQALILCGGLATRLDPLGYFIPKPLLPIGGRPIIDYILDDVVDSGIEEIILGTNTIFGTNLGTGWLTTRLRAKSA